MKRETIRPATEAQWLDLRKQDVTSTMVSALYGLSPYLTEFELWHSKRSGLELPFEPNERIRKGQCIQDYAAEEVARKHGWTVWRMDEYIRIPELRMGSSFDYRVKCPERGDGVLEIKAVDYFRHKAAWVDGEAPEHIEIQLQHQLEVADKYEWGMIAAFTSIYDWHEYERDRDREMGAALVQRVRQFWADVEAGNEPDPDFYRDDAVIKALHIGGPEPLDRTEDLEFNALLSRYSLLKDQKKETIEEFEAVQAEIIRRLGNHSEAYGERLKFKTTWVKDNPGKEVTADMVGTRIGERKGFWRCSVTGLHKGGAA